MSSVSIIIAVYNCEKYIGESIESVLGQNTRHELELIVVDDGSTDSSAQQIQSFGKRVNYLYQANAGVGLARNAGIAVSSHPLLAFNDADDIWMENKIELQVNEMISTPDIEAVFGRSVQFLSPELDPKNFTHLKVSHTPIETQLRPGMLIRKTAMERIGLFKHVKVGCDIEWGIRARELGLNFAMLDEVVFRRRIHENNHTSRTQNSQLEYLRIIKQSLDRRRAEQGQSK